MIPFLKPSINKTTITIAVIGLIILYAGFQTMRANRLKADNVILKNENGQLEKIATDQKQETEHYINEYNNQVAVTKATELTLNNVNKLRDTENLAHLKQFNGLKKRLQNLEATMSFDLSFSEDSVPVKTIKIPCKGDSVKAFEYSYKDEFNDIFAIVIDTPRFDIRVPLKSALFIGKREKKFLFVRYGPRSYQIESYTPNKLAKIDGQTLYKVSRK